MKRKLFIYLAIFILAISLLGCCGLLKETCILLRTKDVYNGILTSCIYCLFVTFINLILGSIVGKYLASYHGSNQFIIDVILLMPLIVPTILIISSFQYILIKIGLVNNMYAVIVINLLPTLPYSIKIFRNDYNNIGTKYFLQSKLLGFNKLEEIIYVNLPLLKKSYESVFLFAFTISLSQYAIVSIVGGGEIVGLSMVFFPYFNSSDKSPLLPFSIIFISLSVLAVMLFNFLISTVIYISKKT